jgi:hypothetical protein
MGGVTPELFGKFLADMITPQVVNAVGEKVKAALREAPAKMWDVVRQTPAGPVKKQVTLAAIIAELTDQMIIGNTLKGHLLQSNAALINELQLNRKIGEQMVKEQAQKQEKRERRRRNEEEDEDED